MRPHSDSSRSLTGRTHPEHDWAWILSQDEVWVDARLREHAIEQMPEDYVGNVIDFCRSCLSYLPELGTAALFSDELAPAAGIDETPLLKALRERLAVAKLQTVLAAPTVRSQRVAEPLVVTQSSSAAKLSL